MSFPMKIRVFGRLREKNDRKTLFYRQKQVA